MSEDENNTPNTTEKIAEVLALPISAGVGFMFGQNNITNLASNSLQLLHEPLAANTHGIGAQAVKEAPTVAEKWRFLQKQQKQSVLLNGVIATGITLGVMLTLAKSKNIFNLKRQKNNDTDISRS